jgi:hypothetical protein
MMLTLFQRNKEGFEPPVPSGEVWRVRIGGGEGEGGAADFLPASLLAPDIEAMRPYPFGEFVGLVERLERTPPEEPPEHTAWTALPISIACAQGEQAEPVSIRSREAAEVAVREWVSFARRAFPESASLWVRVE